MNSTWLRIAFAPLLALGLTGCDAEVEDPGELPSADVDVEPGRAPDVDVETPDVDVETREKTVDVPDVDIDVDSEKKKVNVPDVDVDLPDDNDDPTNE